MDRAGSKKITGMAPITFETRLDSQSCSRIYKQTEQQILKADQPVIVLDFKQVDHMDTAGALFILRLESLARQHGKTLHRINLSGTHQQQLADTPRMDIATLLKSRSGDMGLIRKAGGSFSDFLADVYEFIACFGEICRALFTTLFHPGQLRWGETVLVAERAGINALPIVALISFIVGLVMAFQAAMPMRMFGAELYVANLIGIAMVRELGPLMTAIVLAGRSASAFAAEIGTMRINQEIDALTIMGLNPVKFLMVPRVVASIFITPLLAISANLMGIIGGAVVLLSLGFPLISYYQQITNFVTWVDFTGGLIKCFIFGILIASTGCIRGYQAAGGPSAVGLATTSAVVTSIVLIAVFDGIFSVTYYYLGI